MYLEKELVKKDFYEFENTSTSLIYCKNKDETAFFSLSKQDDGMWKVSFPLKNDTVNYATYFLSYLDAKTYAEELVQRL